MLLHGDIVSRARDSSLFSFTSIQIRALPSQYLTELVSLDLSGYSGIEDSERRYSKVEIPGGSASSSNY